MRDHAPWKAEESEVTLKPGETPLRVLLRDEDGVDVGLVGLVWKPADQTLTVSAFLADDFTDVLTHISHLDAGAIWHD